MFERLKRLYEEGRITEAGLRKAVVNRLISECEYEAITGNPYIAEAAGNDDQIENHE